MNRDLDAVIVEKIFNWRLIPVSADYDGNNACEILYPPDKEPTQDFYNTLPRIGKLHRGWWAPRYSGDLSLAIMLCQKVALPMSIIEMPLNPEYLAQKALTWWESNGDKQVEDDYAAALDQALALLRDLADLQNGPPLETHREQWESTMAAVYSFLDKHEPSGEI